MLPPKIAALFEAVEDATLDETELYGPYNALLDFCFPWEEGWNVVPQYCQPRRWKTTDATTVFLVKNQKVPVFFLQVKPAAHLQNLATRASADKQMRERFAELQELVQTPKLHAFSALGSKFAHYKFTSKDMELSPAETPRNACYLTDTAPMNSWDADLLTQDGLSLFMNVVSDVKQMSLQLGH